MGELERTNGSSVEVNVIERSDAQEIHNLSTAGRIITNLPRFMLPTM
jgi:hypothetical protein